MNYQRDSTSGIEGLELIERLRQVDATVPIVALTAWGNVDLAVSAMKHGASDFIEKPWRNDTLLEKVRSLTQRVQQVRSSQRISEFERHDAHELQTRIVPQRHLTGARESRSSVTAYPRAWWAATTSGYGSPRRTYCTSAWPTSRGKARPAR